MWLILLALLILATEGVIFIAALRVLWCNPPKFLLEMYLPSSIRVDVLPTTIKLPEGPIQIEFMQKSQPRLPAVEGDEEPIPMDIFEYCELESDEWARAARKRHARQLKRELGGWEHVLARLVAEDYTPEEVHIEEVSK